MTLSVRSSGVWVSPEKVWVKTGGVWVEVQKVYIRQAGVWSEVFTNVTYSVPTGSHTATALSPSNSLITLIMNSDGTGTISGTNLSTVNFDFRVPTGTGVANVLWVQVAPTSGSFTSGSATSTWLQLNSARSWTLTRASIGTATVVSTVSLSTDSGGSNVVATGSLTLAATVDA